MKEQSFRPLVEGQIRPIAIGIFWRDDQILVFEGYDPACDETFYRPLGGAIEFGEYGHQALAREVREEIDTEIENIRYLGLSENLFTFDGGAGHEIVLIYEGDLVGEAIYEQDEIMGCEDDGSPMKVVWTSLERFQRGEAPLYPDGLLAFLLEPGMSRSPSSKNPDDRQGSPDGWHSGPERVVSTGICRSPLSEDSLSKNSLSQNPPGESSASERPHHDEE